MPLDGFGNSSMDILSHQGSKDGTGQPRDSEGHPGGSKEAARRAKIVEVSGRVSGLFTREYTGKTVGAEIKGLTTEIGWWPEALKNGAAERIRRIEKHQARGLQLARFIEEKVGEKKLGRRLGDCGTHLIFRHWLVPGRARLHHANFCNKHVLCTLCAAARAGKIVIACDEKLQAVFEERPKLKAVSVTFTAENKENLGEAVEVMRGGWNKLLERRRNHLKGNCGSALSCVAGGFVGLEIKRGARKRLWHPHLHGMLLLEDWIDQEELHEEWKRATGNPKTHIPNLKLRDYKEPNFLKHVAEACKYPTKPGDLSHEDLWTVYQSLNGSRQLTSFFGCLRGVSIDESNLAEDSSEMFGPFLDYYLKMYEEGWRGQGCTLGCEEDYEEEEDEQNYDYDSEPLQGFCPGATLGPEVVLVGEKKEKSA